MSNAKAPTLYERLLALSTPVDILPCCETTLQESPHARRCSWCGEALDPDGAAPLKRERRS